MEYPVLKPLKLLSLRVPGRWVQRLKFFRQTSYSKSLYPLNFTLSYPYSINFLKIFFLLKYISFCHSFHFFPVGMVFIIDLHIYFQFNVIQSNSTIILLQINISNKCFYRNVIFYIRLVSSFNSCFSYFYLYFQSRPLDLFINISDKAMSLKRQRVPYHLCLTFILFYCWRFVDCTS